MMSRMKRARAQVSEVKMAGRGAMSPPTISVAELAANFKADVVELAGGGDDQKYVEYETDRNGSEIVIDWLDAATYRLNLTEFEQLKQLLPEFEFKNVNYSDSEVQRESAAQRIVAKVLEHARRGKLGEAMLSAPGVDAHETSVAELAELIRSEVGDDPDEKFVEYTPDSDYSATGLMGGVQILWMNGLYELSAAEFEELKSILSDFDFQVEQDADYFGDGNEPATEAVQVGRGSTQTISVDELARQIADSGQQQLEHAEIGGQYAVYAPDGRYMLSAEEFRRLQELLDGVQFASVES